MKQSSLLYLTIVIFLFFGTCQLLMLGIKKMTYFIDGTQLILAQNIYNGFITQFEKVV